MSLLIPGRGLLITHQWRRHQFKSASQILLNNPFPPYFLVLWACCLLSPVWLFATDSHSLLPTSLLCPWDSPGKNPGMYCHALLRGIFPRDQAHVCIAGRFFTAKLSGSPTSCSPSHYKCQKKRFSLCLNLRHWAYKPKSVIMMWWFSH